MTAGGVEVAGRVFRLRRLTGAVQLELTRAQAHVADAEDLVAGLEAELKHLGDRIDAMAGAAGEFDRDEVRRLNDARKALREEQAAAHAAVVEAMMMVLIARCEPTDVTVEWCVENMEFPADFFRIMRGDKEDDQDPPSTAPDASSS